jgi:hypothetical protein
MYFLVSSRCAPHFLLAYSHQFDGDFDVRRRSVPPNWAAQLRAGQGLLKEVCDDRSSERRHHSWIKRLDDPGVSPQAFLFLEATQAEASIGTYVSVCRSFVSEFEEELVGAVMQWQRQEMQTDVPDILDATGGSGEGSAEAAQQEGQGLTSAPPVFTTPSFKEKKVLCAWACMRACVRACVREWVSAIW